MTDDWQTIKITSFEYVTAGASTSLLRLSGTAPRRRTASQRPELVLDNGGQRYRYASLPAPDDPPGTLQAAYSLPSALIDPTSTFWLEHVDGSLTELPPPAEGQSRAADAGRSGAKPARPAAQAALAAAEAENERLSDTLEELETWRGELERRLAATTDELSVAKEAREAAEREGSDTLAAQATEIELLVAELASVRAERAELARRADRLAAAVEQALKPAQELAELARRGLDRWSETPNRDSTGDASS